MTTKLDKCAQRVNHAFTDKLAEAFKKKFRRGLTTEFNIISMSLISRPTNGKPFTPEQKKWVQAFEDGYSAASDIVFWMAQETRK